MQMLKPARAVLFAGIVLALSHAPVFSSEADDADVEEGRPVRAARAPKYATRASSRFEADDADVEVAQVSTPRRIQTERPRQRAQEREIFAEPPVINEAPIPIQREPQYREPIQRIEPPREIAPQRLPEPIPAPAIRQAPVPQGPAVIAVGESNWDAEVGQHRGPILIDVYSKLCGPCMQTAPIVESVAEQFRGRVKVVKIDSAKAQSLVDRYNVTSLPTLIMINGGQEVHRTTGTPQRELLEGWMNSASR